MKVTNRSPGLQGVHTLNGVAFLRPGETRDDLALTVEQARRADRLPFITVEGEPHPSSGEANSAKPVGSGESEAMAVMRRQFDASFKMKCDELRAASDDLTTWKQKATDLETQLHAANAELEALRSADKPVRKLEAKHKGGGSYSIWDAEGNEVLSKLSKDDAEAFNEMSTEEQAVYVGKSKAA